MHTKERVQLGLGGHTPSTGTLMVTSGSLSTAVDAGPGVFTHCATSHDIRPRRTTSALSGTTWQVPLCMAQVTVSSLNPLFSTPEARPLLVQVLPPATASTSVATQSGSEHKLSIRTGTQLRNITKETQEAPLEPTITIVSSETD